MNSQPVEPVSIKLLPGSKFPEIELMTDEGFTTSLSATGSYKLVLVFRGAFCSFCERKLFDWSMKYHFILLKVGPFFSDAPGNQP